MSRAGLDVATIRLLVTENRRAADLARAAARSIEGGTAFDIGRRTAYEAIARGHDQRITELLTDGCGTEAGYDRHRRRGELACDRCLAAHAASRRARYQRRKEISA